MNQGRIWCVVNPTVGLPLFLGSVAVTSLIVHACVMTHTDWMSNYWEGGAKKVSMNEAPTAALTKSDAGFTMTMAPVAATTSTPASFVITVTPNAAATPAPAVATPAAVVRTASTN